MIHANMIRANLDILAVAVLIAGAAVVSVAHKVEGWDVLSGPKLALERVTHQPAGSRMLSLPAVFSCLQN